MGKRGIQEIEAAPEHRTLLQAVANMAIGNKPTKVMQREVGRFCANHWARQLPRTLWHSWSEVTTYKIGKHAARFGFAASLGGNGSIDLADFVKRFHELCDELLAAEKRAPVDNAGDQDWLSKKRQEEFYMAQYDRLHRERRIVSIETLEGSLARLVTILVQTIDTLQRNYGNDAADIVREALDEFEREVAEQIASSNGGAA